MVYRLIEPAYRLKERLAYLDNSKMQERRWQVIKWLVETMPKCEIKDTRGKDVVNRMIEGMSKG